MIDYIRKELAARRERLVVIEDSIKVLESERGDIPPAIKALEDVLAIYEAEEAKKKKNETARAGEGETRPAPAAPPPEREKRSEGETAKAASPAPQKAVDQASPSPKTEEIPFNPPEKIIKDLRAEPPKPAGMLPDGRLTPGIHWEKAADRNTEAARKLPPSKPSATEPPPSWRKNPRETSGAVKKGKISIVGNYLEAGGYALRLKGNDELLFMTTLVNSQPQAVPKKALQANLKLEVDFIWRELSLRMAERKIPFLIKIEGDGYRITWSKTDVQ